MAGPAVSRQSRRAGARLRLVEAAATAAQLRLCPEIRCAGGRPQRGPAPREQRFPQAALGKFGSPARCRLRPAAQQGPAGATGSPVPRLHPGPAGNIAVPRRSGDRRRLRPRGRGPQPPRRPTDAAGGPWLVAPQAGGQVWSQAPPAGQQKLCPATARRTGETTDPGAARRPGSDPHAEHHFRSLAAGRQRVPPPAEALFQFRVSVCEEPFLAAAARLCPSLGPGPPPPPCRSPAPS